MEPKWCHGGARKASKSRTAYRKAIALTSVGIWPKIGPRKRKVGERFSDFFEAFNVPFVVLIFNGFLGWFLDRVLHQFHALFGYLRVSFASQLILRKTHSAYTGAWFLRF